VRRENEDIVHRTTITEGSTSAPRNVTQEKITMHRKNETVGKQKNRSPEKGRRETKFMTVEEACTISFGTFMIVNEACSGSFGALMTTL
jgi:hypothetical protein